MALKGQLPLNDCSKMDPHSNILALFHIKNGKHGVEAEAGCGLIIGENVTASFLLFCLPFFLFT